jgi:hypothetical protein
MLLANNFSYRDDLRTSRFFRSFPSNTAIICHRLLSWKKNVDLLNKRRSFLLPFGTVSSWHLVVVSHYRMHCLLSVSFGWAFFLSLLSIGGSWTIPRPSRIRLAERSFGLRSPCSRKTMDEDDEFGDASFLMAFDIDAAVDTAAQVKKEILAPAPSPQMGLVASHASQTASFVVSASHTYDDHYDPSRTKKRRKVSPETKNNPSSSSLILEATLQKYFGYDKFRPGQKAAIQAILDQEDVAVFWATGSGKSRNRGGEPCEYGCGQRHGVACHFGLYIFVPKMSLGSYALF